jgi:hypothetical protein
MAALCTLLVACFGAVWAECYSLHHVGGPGPTGLEFVPGQFVFALCQRIYIFMLPCAISLSLSFAPLVLSSGNLLRLAVLRIIYSGVSY